MKSLIIILVSLALTACGTTSGTWSKVPVINPDGTVARNLLGFPVYEKTRTSQHAAIAQSAANAFSGRESKAEPGCAFLGDISGLTSAQITAYFSAVQECERSRGTAKLVAMALGRPSTSTGEVIKGYADIVASVESGKTARFRSGVSAIASLGTSAIIGAAVKSGFDSLEAVGVEAARNGNTTIGDVSVSTAQSVANSNDPSAGEGSASSTADSTLTGGDINLSLGRGNRSFVTNDTSRLNATDANIQALESSANGSQLNDSRTSGQITSDDFTGDTNNSDDDSALTP